jgi:hypothetical protein
VTQPDFQQQPSGATHPSTGGGETLSSFRPPELTPAAATGPGSSVVVPRGLLLAAWVAAVALVVLALVAVVWTIELIRLQMELQEAARAVRTYLSQLGGMFGSGSATQCPNGEPVC